MGRVTNVKEFIQIYIKKFEQTLEGRTLYFFGAGEYCENLARDFKYRDRVKGIFDNDINKSGQQIAGISIIHVIELKNLDLDRVVIVISCSCFRKIEEQLTNLGVKNIFNSNFLGHIDTSILDLIAMHSYDIIHSDYFDLNDDDLLNIENLKNILCDDVSKGIVDIIVDRRKNKFLYYGDICSANQYFQKDIFQFSVDEVMIEGGAYTGDTIEQFKQIVNSKYKKIYAFEPEVANYQLLCKNMKNEKNVVCIKAGLWDQETVLCFNSFETGSSTISVEGDIEIMVNAIDNVATERVTFIKMDIEGAERKALEGARNVILRDKPKLAICIYHLRDDLWEIPFYLKNLVPEYQFYIRHHSDTIFETVLYAVPISAV